MSQRLPLISLDFVLSRKALARRWLGEAGAEWLRRSSFLFAFPSSVRSLEKPWWRSKPGSGSQLIRLLLYLGVTNTNTNNDNAIDTSLLVPSQPFPSPSCVCSPGRPWQRAKSRSVSLWFVFPLFFGVTKAHTHWRKQYNKYITEHINSFPVYW